MIIGLTGGIGSGKTAVSDIFHNFGIDIIDMGLHCYLPRHRVRT